MKRASIIALSSRLPERVVTNREIEERVPLLPQGALKRLFGIEERRYAAKEEQVSDLAAAAARPILGRFGAARIDHLIFAAACADLIEPATGNIVQHKLGLRCPAMDVKNACNSFTSGLLTATSLIQAGHCRNVLVVCGEKLSDAIRCDFEEAADLSRHLAAFSLGDAGAAVLVAASDDESGIHFQASLSDGRHWELCTIRGGGSMHPHDVEKLYFEGDTAALRDVLAETAQPFLKRCLDEAGWEVRDIRHFFTHQVSVGVTRLIAELAGVPLPAIEQTFPKFGNTAAASIPVAMHQRLIRREIRKGDKIAWLGLAAGISVSVQLMIW